MALGYTPKPLPQMNMGIQPQLPQPNGFGVFGNDQMLQQNLMRQPGVRPPGMENAFITPTVKDLSTSPKPGGGLPDMEEGIRLQRQKEIERLLSLSDQEFYKWYNSKGGGGRPGSFGDMMVTMRREAAQEKAGVPPGSVKVPTGYGKWAYQLKDGSLWDPSELGPWSREAARKRIEELKQNSGPGFDIPMVALKTTKTPKEQKLGKETSQVLAKTLFG